MVVSLFDEIPHGKWERKKFGFFFGLVYLVKYHMDTAPAMTNCCEARMNSEIHITPTSQYQNR